MALPVIGARFQPLEHYRPEAAGYKLLPLRFLRFDQRILLTNEAGEHIFLSDEDFGAFVRHQLSADHPAYAELKAKHLLTDTGLDIPIELLATKYRTKKSFLAGSARLHLFVVTLRCDHTCRYCQVSRVTKDRARFDMSRETAARAIELTLQSPCEHLKVEFQGGESLLNFPLIRWIVEQIERRCAAEGRPVDFVIATNLAPLTDEVLAFCKEHCVVLSTSLDGPEDLHNRNRPRPDRNSYALTLEGIARARTALGNDQVSAIMTTTRHSLGRAREIVDEYARLGFSSVFLRPISPYGFAVRTGEAARYEMLEFLDFYRAGLDQVLALNRRGVPVVETYAQILLTKILTPFAHGYVDLQSPIGTSAVAYNYDGNVFLADEARMLAAMGDASFRLGTVAQSYEELFGGPVVRRALEASVVETLPGCTDCAFLPYCGADPIFHHRTQGDPIGHRPTSAFCTKNMGILRHLFALLEDGDSYTRRLLTSWATGFAAA